VTYTPSITFDTDPGLLEIGGDTSMIAIKYDQTNFITAPWVNITFEYRHYTKLSNGTLIKLKVSFIIFFFFPFRVHLVVTYDDEMI